MDHASNMPIKLPTWIWTLDRHFAAIPLTFTLFPVKDKLKVWIYSFLQKVKKGNDKVEIEKFLFNFFKNIKRKLIVQDQVIFAEFFPTSNGLKVLFAANDQMKTLSSVATFLDFDTWEKSDHGAM